MPTEKIKLRFTPEFKRNVRALTKRYRTIRSDLEPTLNQLKSGDFVGEQIQGSSYTLYKTRIRNSDVNKGKRSGYRVIYYLKTDKDVILVTIYSKSDQGDISKKRIREILNAFEARE